jgi:hypothetical protein
MDQNDELEFRFRLFSEEPGKKKLKCSQEPKD